jgi:hypothetical protein
MKVKFECSEQDYTNNYENTFIINDNQGLGIFDDDQSSIHTSTCENNELQLVKPCITKSKVNKVDSKEEEYMKSFNNIFTIIDDLSPHDLSLDIFGDHHTKFAHTKYSHKKLTRKHEYGSVKDIKNNYKKNPQTYKSFLNRIKEHIGQNNNDQKNKCKSFDQNQ